VPIHSAASTPTPTPEPNCPFAKPGGVVDSAVCESRHQESQKTLGRNVDAWFAAPALQEIDVRKLRQSECMCDGPGFGKDLSQAVGMADLAVLGHVVKIGPYSEWGTVTTFAVERTAKGRASATVSFWQFGKPEPADGYQALRPVAMTGREPAVLVLEPGEDFLFPGDRAVVLLRATADEPGASYRAVAYPGSIYPIIDGRVIARNVFSDVAGTSEQQVVERISAIARTHPDVDPWPPTG
jgi:hypothetical protein